MATSDQFQIEEDKELLLSRVTQLVFVDGVAGYECGRCERTLIKHYRANCGHYFCANCKRVITLSKSNCPLAHCKKPITDIDFQDIEFDRKLYDLRAHCPNKNYGCPFVSPLKELGGHLRVCRDTRENALPVLIQDNSTVETILRQLSIKLNKLSADVNQRLKDIETKVDNNKAEVEFKMAEMIIKLDEKINKTEVELLRADMKENKAEADNIRIEIDRRLAEIKGKLDEKANRAEMTQQIKRESEQTAAKITVESKAYADEKAKEIMSECIQRITTLEENNSLIKLTEISNLEQKVSYLERCNLLRNPQMTCLTLAENKSNFPPDFTWKITQIKDKVKQTSFQIQSEVFQWIGYPVRAQAKLEAYGLGGVFVSLCLKEHNKGNTIDVKLIPRVYYVLRDRTNAINPKHRCSSPIILLNKKFDYYLEYTSFLCQKSHLIDSAYNVDDSIVMEVYVEPPAMAQMVHDYDGTLIWAIYNYQKGKEMAKDELVLYHESPYFYTGPKGYRVQVQMFLEGLGGHTGKGLSAAINFLAGEFDSDLPATFPHLTTITLFNRKDPQRNITKTAGKDIISDNYYYIDMCTDEELEDVLHNDAIFYKVTIKPSN